MNFVKALNNLLSSRDKQVLAMLLGLSILVSIFETLSIKAICFFALWYFNAAHFCFFNIYRRDFYGAVCLQYAFFCELENDDSTKLFFECKKFFDYKGFFKKYCQCW